MQKIALSLLLAAGLAQADCTFSNPSNLDVSWKAYKTPMKLGVGGHFTSAALTAPVSKAADLNVLLSGTGADITVASVDSSNKGRDEKLLNSFFKQMAGPDIKAKIIKLDSGDTTTSGTATVSITMNGVTRNVPMKYGFNDGKLRAEGVIDLIDFKAQNALTSINTACYDLHQGKTWSDVNIGFTMDIKTSCP